jgi:hypothetical protein
LWGKPGGLSRRGELACKSEPISILFRRDFRMKKTSFLSRIYVYVSCDSDPADQSRLINIANASGTSIAGGYLENPEKVVDCLSALGCEAPRLPQAHGREDFVRVISNVRPRDLDSALALLD